MSDGLLLVDKGSGVSSFQVVAHVRRVLREAKVGHGGTLDPMATGILPLLLGAATKLTPYLQAQDKEYVAVIRLGVTTDTLDATGRITGERAVPALDRVALDAVLTRFVGEIDQVPPMFSALHAGGRRLHELARAGVEVERAARRVRIDAIDLTDWAPPCLTVRVACGKGTYIRSLAADVGAALGCGARLETLTRTRLGRFSLDDAVPWSVVREGNAVALRAALLPPDRAVDHLPARTVSEAEARRLAHGQLLPADEANPAPEAEPEGLCRLYAGSRFLGIGQVGPSGVRPLRLLHADHPRPRPVSP
ncbi:MAG TPA: tRNA pseudouridine(55) synthase TruB [Methylomirabilota bacterium]|nr:tRNA pseudouridine(55) synthase TruB [Methylomirabilota bacterium]